MARKRGRPVGSGGIPRQDLFLAKTLEGLGVSRSNIGRRMGFEYPTAARYCDIAPERGVDGLPAEQVIAYILAQYEEAQC